MRRRKRMMIIRRNRGERRGGKLSPVICRTGFHLRRGIATDQRDKRWQIPHTRGVTKTWRNIAPTSLITESTQFRCGPGRIAGRYATDTSINSSLGCDSINRAYLVIFWWWLKVLEQFRSSFGAVLESQFKNWIN